MCNLNLWACNPVLTEQSMSRHRLKFTHRPVNKQKAIPQVAYSLFENKILCKTKKSQHFQKKLAITNWLSIWFWNKNTKHLHLPRMGTSECPLEVTSCLSIPGEPQKCPHQPGTWQDMNIWALAVNLGYSLEWPVQSGLTSGEPDLISLEGGLDLTVL